MVERMLEWFDRRDDPDPGSCTPASSGPTRRTATRSGYHDRYRADDVPDFRGHASPRGRAGQPPPGGRGHRPSPASGAPTDERDRRQLRATYYGMMAEVDDQLGRLFQGLDDRGLTDDTLVVLTSDHGDQMGDHWLVEKLGWWDESYHVPLIVCDPRPEAAARRGRGGLRAPPSTSTCCPPCAPGWASRCPLQCDGRALQPFLHGEPGADGPDGWRPAVHWEWDFRNPWLLLAEDRWASPWSSAA